MMYMFTIQDLKAEFYNTPFTARTVADALRSFSLLVNDQNTNIAKFPEDYILHQIGEFDEQTGVLIAKDTIQIARAVDYVKESQ